MNNFMRKLHGADDEEEDFKPKRTPAATAKKSNPPAKEVKAVVQ